MWLQCRCRGPEYQEEDLARDSGIEREEKNVLEGSRMAGKDELGPLGSSGSKVASLSFNKLPFLSLLAEQTFPFTPSSHPSD